MANDNDKPTNDEQPAPEKKLVTGSAFIRQQPNAMSVEDVVKKGAAEGITVSPNLVRLVRRNVEKKKASGSKKASDSKKAGPVKRTSAKPASSKQPSAAEKLAAIKKSLAAKQSGAAKKAPIHVKGATNAPKPAPVTKATPATTFKVTKVAFVLKHPRATSAAYIIEAGRQVGVEVTVSQIHSIRSKAKSSKRKAKGHVGAVSTTASASKAASSPTPGGTVTKKTASSPVKAVQPSGGRDAEQDDHDEAFFAHVLRIGLTRAEQLLTTVTDQLAKLTHRR